ncbi:MAG: DUF1294 domain-containing protein [Ruminococcaceae bacterium]|nr:DUF1294 domain-containing protein [Oscillospiraceae bacterium]
MLPFPWPILLGYIAVVSLVSITICIYDKTISKRNNVKLRIPEKTLFICSALGGSLAMFITMQLIRHKTNHLSFMIGIPVIFILQVALIAALTYFQILPSLF